MSLIKTIGLPKGCSGQFIVDGVADGYEAFALATAAAEMAPDRPLLFVARAGQRLPQIVEALAFVAPDLPVLELPAWDCLPYDRVSPGSDAASRRLDTLAAMIALRKSPHRAIVLTTANSLLQRIPPSAAIEAQEFHAKSGNKIEMNVLVAQLERAGFERVPTVHGVGEFAVRGGILDLYAPGEEDALRLDFFGDTLETIRAFDVASQRTTGSCNSVTIQPMSEVALTPETISKFRRSYFCAFGVPSRDDALYAAVSEGRRFAGIEHWLPFFYSHLETMFDYLPDAPVVFDHLARESLSERHTLILDHYDYRRKQAKGDGLKDAMPYKPVAPEQMYLSPEEITSALADKVNAELTPFDTPFSSGRKVLHAGSRAGRSFTEERADPKANVFDVVARHIADQRAAKRRVVVAGWTEGSLDRLEQILDEHHLGNLKRVTNLAEVEALKPGEAGLAVLPIEAGFESGELIFVAEQDILDDRLIRCSKKRKRAADFIAEASLLSAGDIVVHADHGIGRFVGLKPIEAAGAPHDCLEIHYASDGRLFLPVENIELLSRYGSDSAEAQLDKLGGGAWQSRKAKLKRRLLEMADRLIKIAAERHTREAPAMKPPDGVYGEFAARFPHEETDDQQSAIYSVIEDLAAGKPMDRLICGDVGFGKTEVALRAAFIAAMEGFQVAVVVPTTLLSRQHFKTFTQRFAGFSIKVRQASRLVGTKELAETKQGIANGTVDIVVGTHALLGSSISFKNLGLLIVDEEQHFGVKHKERLKELKSDVHVLTLSATPIPRTLQLALTGARELSLISTPPIDRMAVRNFISPYDPLVIRETLLRERYRDGHSFYIVPRISDLAEVHQFLQESVPELKVIVAHGQMAAGQLDDIMNAFYDGQYDVLLSTTIIESGLDIPNANTLIVHRADMFGLSQLYQLRGRVGRSKVRAYALFTLPVNRTLTTTADRRLKVLQSLDTLGVCFQLASHDLDIRGAGNLLNEEQSGHIKEVGFELYQQMLEEAVAELRGTGEAIDTGWSPLIAVGTAVMIPEAYVSDLQLRLGLYRRLGDLENTEEIDGFGAELIDRFGPLPEEVKRLLKIVFIKALCRRANVERLDAGPKGVVVQFRKREFTNPAGLVRYIAEQDSLAKIRPDHSVVFARDWPNPEKQLAGSTVIMMQLAKLAEQAA